MFFCTYGFTSLPWTMVTGRITVLHQEGAAHGGPAAHALNVC